MKNVLLAGFLACFPLLMNAQIIADFEQILSAGDTVINGANGTDTVRSGAAAFPITYNPDFGGFWSGNWAVSSVQNDSVGGSGNLYGAITGSGNRNSAAFAIGQQDAIIHLEGPARGRPVRGLYLTNTTYAHNSMRDGDTFAKAFGGEDGTDPDFFRLTIHGYRNGQRTLDSIDFYLGDYRFEADSLDYLVDSWQFVDLLSLGPVDSLVFHLQSSDVGDFGMNTPAFFAIDDVLMAEPDSPSTYQIGFERPFVGVDQADNGSSGHGGFDQGQAFFPNEYVQEFGGYWASGWAISGRMDSVSSGLDNLLSAKPGRGQAESLQYAVGQQGSVIHLQSIARGSIVQGLWLTNTTYAHNSMRDGDIFAKAFGGEDGSDPDFFRLSVSGYLNGVPTTDSISVYLADYRFAEDSLDYILDDWTFVDLQVLGPVDSLVFTMASSDVGDFGINTPTFFAIDQLILTDPSTLQGIAADDPSLVAWATGIDLLRGPTDIANPEADTVTAGESEDAVGPYTPAAVSLGDGGMATLTFEQPIYDGEGPDFVVFENGFPSGDGYFLELALVEVSSDGEYFVRFPATSLTDTSTQIGTFGSLRPENLRNLAGRFPGRIGTPFDLAALRGAPGLRLDSITYVRLIDVVGSVDPAYASYDQEGRAINDPYPTNFESGGFDVSAVGALNVRVSTAIFNGIPVKPLIIYPNPAANVLHIQLPMDQGQGMLTIFDLQGRPVRHLSVGGERMESLRVSDLIRGVYLVQYRTDSAVYMNRFIRR